MTAAAHSSSIRRDGDALVFSGTLDRATVPVLWKASASLLTEVTRLDLTAVDRVDSAGVALLAELAGQTGASQVDGNPIGLAELRRAYRLGPALGFAT